LVILRTLIRDQSGDKVKKLIQILKHQLHIEESALGCYIQKVPIVDLARYLKSNENPNRDPVWMALKNEEFSACTSGPVNVDVNSSIGVLGEMKLAGEKKGCVLLAWAMTDGEGAKGTLLGAAVVTPFIKHKDIGTSMLKDFDRGAIGKYLEKPNRSVFIDTLCSMRSGVGSLLVRHACAYAIQRKCPGIVALAVGRASPATFTKLGFKAHGNTTLEQPRPASSYSGDWFSMSTDISTQASLAETMEHLKTLITNPGTLTRSNMCMRSGLTARSSGSVMWRC